jgi:hypothetical protein
MVFKEQYYQSRSQRRFMWDMTLLPSPKMCDLVFAFHTFFHPQTSFELQRKASCNRHDDEDAQKAARWGVGFCGNDWV